MSGTPRIVDGPTASSAAEDQARVERMVEAVRRLGDQLEATHRTLDVFVERLSTAAREAQSPASAPATAGAPTPARAARPPIGTPVRRPEPVDPAGDPRREPPAGLAEHLRGPIEPGGAGPA